MKHCPRHNSNAERYNKTLARERIYARVYTCSCQRREAIDSWLDEFN
ncbi:MAG: transposase [Corynebacterium pollutisoli]|uniref:Transposase n=1 Tax=Corynebacterium pollutisoli TaxID=1610489 RepID=A0A7X8MXZ6_9CORY|nr:transposase [Corynebacterium pollutisoli]